MLTKSLWLAPIMVLALTQPTAQEKAKQDLDKMQGVWTMHVLEIDGKETTKIEGTLLTVKKADYKTTVKGKELPGFRIVLDATKDPKWIDMIKTEADGSEQIFKGIYKFENDTLKMCRGAMPQQERPNQFATWPNTGYFVVTWKKQVK